MEAEEQILKMYNKTNGELEESEVIIDSMEINRSAVKVPTIDTTELDIFLFGSSYKRWQFSVVHHLFHINRLELVRDRLSFPIPPHRKTVYDLLFLTKGSTTRAKGLNEYLVGPNQFFFLPAFQISSHTHLDKDVQGYFLHFDKAIFEEFSGSHILDYFPFLNFLGYPVVDIPESGMSPIHNIFSRLQSLCTGMEKQDLKLAAFYLLALFAEVNKYVKDERSVKETTSTILTQNYKNALTENIYQFQRVKEYAKLLHVTPNHLNKCVQKTLSKTAQSLLNEMLILESKSLLKFSDLQISEIAERLGGRSPSNFARFFKRETGLSPKQYLNS